MMMQPVMNQPMSMGGAWMMPPQQIIPGCPPGLEYLTMVDQVIIKQVVDILETFIDFEISNTYKIVNIMGQTVYNAGEESGCLSRICCRKQRGFKIHITNNFGQEVITVQRPFKCCPTITGCSCPCAGRWWVEEISVYSPTGEIFGNVRQNCSCFCPRYVVLDAQDRPVLLIEGPNCIRLMCPMAEFRIVTADRTVQLGAIKKQWGGLLKEMFTDADNFGVQFPMDLDVRMKAALMGGAFLIDFNYYEDNRKSIHETLHDR